MRALGIILLVLGSILIAINIVSFVIWSPTEYYEKIKVEFDHPVKNGILYYIGALALIITGLILFLIAFLIKKQLAREPKKNLLDSFLEQHTKNNI